MNNIEKYISIRTILLCPLRLKFLNLFSEWVVEIPNGSKQLCKLVTKRGGTNSSRYVTRCQRLKV